MSTRRRFLAGAAAAGATMLAAPALAQNLIEWRMATAWPKGLPGAGTGAQRLADRIGVLTQGQLTIKLYAAGELVPSDQNMAAVMSGEVEMSHDMSAYYLSKSPAFAFFSAIPFGLIAQEFDAWLYAGGGRALWDELGGQFGVKAFAPAIPARASAAGSAGRSTVSPISRACGSASAGWPARPFPSSAFSRC